jgi:hypothetical protein
LSINGSNNTPWKGRFSNIVHGNSQKSCRKIYVDGELNDLKNNVDEESKVPLDIILRAWMAKKALKTLDNNSGVGRSTQVKYLVQILTYDGFVVHHYAYMVRVIQEVESTCFEQAVGNPEWDNAMDEKMVVLDANAIWELVALLMDENQIGCKWVYKIKHNANGFMNIYKARLVAKGYAETYGINYEESYNIYCLTSSNLKENPQIHAYFL